MQTRFFTISNTIHPPMEKVFFAYIFGSHKQFEPCQGSGFGPLYELPIEVGAIVISVGSLFLRKGHKKQFNACVLR